MEIKTEIKIRLMYLAIYEVGENRLLYHCKVSLVFNNSIQMNNYVNMIIKKVIEEQNKETKIFKTMLYEEFPVKFIWGDDGNTKIYISEK